MNNSKTVKAVRAQIHLGIIPLNVYQLPSLIYKLAGRNVTDAIDEDLITLLRFYGVKSLKALPGAGLESYKINPGKEGSPFIPVSIEDAVTYWGEMARRGNEKANAILVACAIEAIERRADHVLGIQVEEEMRNVRMKVRIDSILGRKFWTDTIDWYVNNYQIPKDESKWLYVNVSDMLNKRFFGMKAKDIREQFNIPAGDLIRDHLTPENLIEIQFVERHAAITVKQGSNPVNALEMAMDFAGIGQRPFA